MGVLPGQLWRRGGPQSLPGVVLITDPGPDPDDVKALLITAVMHKQHVIQLKAVVTNGGGRPEQRARLAKSILDLVQLPDVPVGIGSVGNPYEPLPYEYDLVGVEDVPPSQLHTGDLLLQRIVEEAEPKSLTFVLISSLRDFADLVRRFPALVAEKVREVAIQGGLERVGPDEEADPQRPPWRADSSTNNNFDMDAANAAYAFCFDYGVPMTVVSRHAVPKLPMQLARSFALRTECPVMTYLADAQFLGLTGLWQKLCAGLLPARCTKQWYFETFCNIPREDFERRNLDELGPDTQIVRYLHGEILPYDVIAVMTILPFTRDHFSTADDVKIDFRGVTHRFLCKPGTVKAKLVIKLLQDVYHEVVATTTEQPQTNRIRPRLPRVRGAASGRNPPRLVSRLSESLQRNASHSSVSVSTGVPDTDTPTGAQTSREALGHRRWNPAIIEEKLEEALLDARRGQARVAVAMLVVGLVMLAAALSAYAIDLSVTTSRTRPRRAHSDVDFVARMYAYVLLGNVASMVMLLALYPTDAHAVRVRSISAVLCLVLVVVGTIELYMTLTRPDKGGEAAVVAGAIVSCLSVLVGLLALGRTCKLRKEARAMLALMWPVVGGWNLIYCAWGIFDVGVREGSMALARYPDVVGTFSYSAGMAFGMVMLVPAFRRRAQAVLGRLAESRGQRAALAALLSMGSSSEADPRQVCDDAAICFVGKVLHEDLRGIVLSPEETAGAETNLAPDTRSQRANLRSLVPAALKPNYTRVTIDAVAMVDYYVCHSPADPVARRAAALRKVSRRFQQQHGHPPRVWIAPACVDYALKPEEQLQHMPVYQALSKRLLILASPNLVLRLWSVMELYTWQAIGRRKSEIEVEIVGPSADDTVAYFDAFHVLYAGPDEGEEGRATVARMVHAIELGTIANFNSVIRGLMSLVQRAHLTDQGPSQSLADQGASSEPALTGGLAVQAWGRTAHPGAAGSSRLGRTWSAVDIEQPPSSDGSPPLTTFPHEASGSRPSSGHTFATTEAAPGSAPSAPSGDHHSVTSASSRVSRGHHSLGSAPTTSGPTTHLAEVHVDVGGLRRQHLQAAGAPAAQVSANAPAADGPRL